MPILGWPQFTAAFGRQHGQAVMPAHELSVQALAAALARALRMMPDSFFKRLRAAAVLPWMRVTLSRGMA